MSGNTKGKTKFARLRLSQKPTGVKALTLSSNKTHISSFFQKSSDETAPTISSQNSTEDSEIQRKRKSDTISEIKSNDCDNDFDSDSNSEPSKKPKTNASPIANNTPILEIPCTIQSARTPRRSSRRDAQQTIKSETITNFFSTEKDDSLSDFQISKPIPKIPSKLSTSSRRKPISRKKQPDIRKCLQKPCTEETFNQLISDHCALDNIDPNQFQLALAISRSISGDDAKRNNSENCDNPPANGVSDTIKKTLEKFNFKSSHGQVAGGTFTPFFGARATSSRSQKWKNRCTPLTRRVEEFQQEKIRKKVEEILLTNITRSYKPKKEINYIPYEITSTSLQKSFMSEQILFSANAIEANTTNCISQYYTNNLVSPSRVKCGALLRDWDLIPGRDNLFDGIPSSIRKEQEAAEQIDTDLAMEENCIEMTVIKEAEKSSCKNKPEAYTSEPRGYADTTNDLEKTILLDNEDIQNKLDVINTQLQYGQLLNTSSEIIQTVQNTSENNQRYCERSSSPDLFADCDIDEGNNFDDSFNSNSNKNSFNSNKQTPPQESPKIPLISTQDAISQCLDNIETVSLSSGSAHSTIGPSALTDKISTLKANAATASLSSDVSCIEISDEDSPLIPTMSQAVESQPMESTETTSEIISNRACSLGEIRDCKTSERKTASLSSNSYAYGSNQMSGRRQSSEDIFSELNDAASATNNTSETINDTIEFSEKHLRNKEKNVSVAATSEMKLNSISVQRNYLSQDSIEISDDEPLTTQNPSKRNETIAEQEQMSETNISQSQSCALSQDSIEISDDEINYSMNKSKVFTNHSIAECEMQNERSTRADALERSQNAYNSQNSSLSQVSIEISDDEINYSMNKSKHGLNETKHSRENSPFSQSSAMSQHESIEISDEEKEKTLPISDSYTKSIHCKNRHLDGTIINTSKSKVQKESLRGSIRFSELLTDSVLEELESSTMSAFNVEKSKRSMSLRPSTSVHLNSSLSPAKHPTHNFEQDIASNASDIDPNPNYSAFIDDDPAIEIIDDAETEEDLINQSVCKIFENSFKYRQRPSNDLNASSKFRKTQSEVFPDHRFELDVDFAMDDNTELIIQNNLNDSAFPISNTQYDKLSDEFDRLINGSPIKSVPKNNEEIPSKIMDTSRRSNGFLNNSHCSVVDHIDIDLSNENYIIRVGNISPKPNFERMSEIDISDELKKYGLKTSLRRRQAIICLEHIYNRTHPYIEYKKSKSTGTLTQEKRQESRSSQNLNKHTFHATQRQNVAPIINTDSNKINYNVGFACDNLVVASNKLADANQVQIFLPSCPRAKKPWCLQPLHIAWSNLLRANYQVNEHVLLYKPITLNDLKHFFKSIEMNFDNKDLITFLDIHCITFQTNQNNKN